MVGRVGWKKGERTDNMAFFTRSDFMRPLFARFLIRAAFEEPEDIQAMVWFGLVWFNALFFSQFGVNEMKREGYGESAHRVG